MRLLFTLGNFPPSKFGGIATSMFSVIKGLHHSGYDIMVLTTNYKLPPEGKMILNKWTTYEGIKVNYISARFPAFSFRYLFEGFCQVRNADQVHLSSIFFFPSLIFTLFAHILGKPVILTPHGELQNSALQYKSWKKIPYLFLLKLSLKNVIFRATSKDEELQIYKLFHESAVHIIPNFLPIDSPLHREKLNQFVFLGRICKIKRIENLVIACSLSKRFIESDYSLLLAGPSDTEFLDYEIMLKELIVSKRLDSKIKFAGEVNSPEKEELLSQSKALFLVSYSENFGNVVVEALAQGTPVVTTKGTPWQSLDEYNCGYWIDNTPESIASKMDEIISMNEVDFKKMSVNAIALSKEFTEEKVLPIWTELINNIKSRKSDHVR